MTVGMHTDKPSTLEAISLDALTQVSGGCGKKKCCCPRPQPAPQPAPQSTGTSVSTDVSISYQ